MQLQTQRLLLLPLSASQLALLAEDIPALEKELAISYEAEPIEGIFLQIIKGQVAKVAQNEAEYLYHTFWLLVREQDRVVVGSADFKTPPNQLGEVEIGYGLGKNFEGNGYMTEAVKAICDWVLTQEGISHVVAETEPDNMPSQNVLIRCGFAQTKQEKNLWWKL